MQTFLPYPSFKRSVKVLDNKRLNSQRREANQILQVLTGGYPSGAWKHHPAVLMWKGYENALTYYRDCAIREWKRRSYANSLPLSKLQREDVRLPPWWGKRKFHASHRSNLLRKLPEHYEEFGWEEPDDLPYYWPVTIAKLRAQGKVK